MLTLTPAFSYVDRAVSSIKLVCRARPVVSRSKEILSKGRVAKVDVRERKPVRAVVRRVAGSISVGVSEWREDVVGKELTGILA